MMADDWPLAVPDSATSGTDEELRLIFAAFALVVLGLCVAWLG
jgi:hypothetical protein